MGHQAGGLGSEGGSIPRDHTWGTPGEGLEDPWASLVWFGPQSVSTLASLLAARTRDSRPLWRYARSGLVLKHIITSRCPISLS